ncbi:MAG: GtrA family protein [Bacteroides sp.]|nr:GtrA family protein [Bacteroides sp.]
MKIKDIINGNSRLSEIVRFGMVGGLATVLQYGVYVVFVHAVFGGRRAVVASLISYAISFVANFFLSSYFTFHTRPNARKGIGFTLSHLVNMGLQTGLVAIFKEIIGPTLALLPALAICIPVNYFLVRFAFTSKIFGGQGKEEAEDPSSPTLLQDEEKLLD